MHQRHPAPLMLGALFVLMGLVVGTGGAWLLARGGAWHYLPGGLALVLTGLLLLQRNPAALWVHAGLLVAALAWSVWKAGLDLQALLARGDVLCVLALVMLTPWFGRGLAAATRQAARRGLTAAVGAFLAVAAVAGFQGSGPGQDLPQPPGPASAQATAAARAMHGRLAPPLPTPPRPGARNDVAWADRTGTASLRAGSPLPLCTARPAQPARPALVALDTATGTHGPIRC